MNWITIETWLKVWGAFWFLPWRWAFVRELLRVATPADYPRRWKLFWYAVEWSHWNHVGYGDWGDDYGDHQTPGEAAQKWAEFMAELRAPGVREGLERAIEELEAGGADGME